MKKLKLKVLELGATELLTRQQLRNVFGGSDGSDDGSNNDGGGSGDCSGPEASACDRSMDGTCCYTSLGAVYYGKCLSLPPSYIWHCSVFN